MGFNTVASTHLNFIEEIQKLGVEILHLQRIYNEFCISRSLSYVRQVKLANRHIMQCFLVQMQQFRPGTESQFCKLSFASIR